MKKFLFGIVALSAVSFANGGYFKTNTKLDLAKGLEYSAEGKITTTGEQLAKPDTKDLINNTHLLVKVGNNDELILLTGARLGTNFNEAIKPYSYLGARFASSVNDNLKVTLNAMGVLKAGSDDDQKESVKGLKETLKYQLKTDDNDELKKLGIIISHDKNPVLFSGILEGNYSKGTFKIGSIFNSYHFKQNTNHFETFFNGTLNLNFGTAKLNLKHLVGGEKGPATKRWYKLGGNLSGDLSLESNIQENVTLTNKGSFELGTVLARKGDDLDKFEGKKENESIKDKVVYGYDYKLKLENELKYSKNENTVKLNLDYEAKVVDQPMKDKIEIELDGNKVSKNNGNVVHKPVIKIGYNHKSDKLNVDFSSYTKFIINQKLGVIKKDNKEIDLTKLSRVVGIDLTASSTLNSELKVNGLVKYRLYNTDTYTHLLYSGLGYEYSYNKDNIVINSKHQLRNLFNLYSNKLSNDLYIKGVNSVNSTISDTTKVTLGLDNFLNLNVVSDASKQEIKSYVHFAPSVKVEYSKDKLSVDSTLKSAILRYSTSRYTYSNNEFLSSYNIGVLNSLETNLNYNVNDFVTLGTGLGLHYNYNTPNKDNIKDFMNNFDKLDSKIKLNKDKHEEVTELLKDVKLPELKIDNKGNITGNNVFKIVPNVNMTVKLASNKLVMKTKLEPTLELNSNITGVTNKDTFGPTNIKFKGTLDIEYTW